MHKPGIPDAFEATFGKKFPPPQESTAGSPVENPALTLRKELQLAEALILARYGQVRMHVDLPQSGEWKRRLETHNGEIRVSSHSTSTNTHYSKLGTMMEELMIVVAQALPDLIRAIDDAVTPRQQALAVAIEQTRQVVKGLTP